MLDFAVKQSDQIENTDARLLALNNGARISVANMFLLQNDSTSGNILMLSPIFDNFLKSTAAYHALLLAPLNLSQNKYAVKLYEFVKSNYGAMSSSIKRMYNMLFQLSKKMDTGIDTKVPLNTLIGMSEYDKYSIVKSNELDNRFAYYLPRKTITQNLLGLQNQTYQGYQMQFYKYLREMNDEMLELVSRSTLSSLENDLDTFYHTNVVPINANYLSWGTSSDKKVENLWLLNAQKNKCYGFGIKDSEICKELMLILTKAPSYAAIKVFMLKYSQPVYNNIWSNRNEMIDLASRGRINLSIARRFLRYLGFRYANYLEPLRQFTFAYDNWIRTDGNIHFNDPMFTQTITANKKVADFLKVISEYVAYTYTVRVADNVEEIVNLGKAVPLTSYTKDPEKTWDYAERYDEYLDEVDFVAPRPQNNYDLFMMLLTDPLLNKKLEYFSSLDLGSLPKVKKISEMSIDEYFRTMEPPKQHLGAFNILAGGSLCKKSSRLYLEHAYKEMLDTLKEQGLELDTKDQENINNQIHNLKIYWHELNKATKNFKNLNNTETKENWHHAYKEYNKQELKVLISLTKLLRKIGKLD
jgi:hypothetical protein